MSDETWDLPGITHWDGCGEIGTPEHAGCFISMDQPPPRRVPPERVILLDLIAELKNPATGFKDDCDGPWPRCGDHREEACTLHYAVAVEHAAGRTEQRLNEVADAGDTGRALRHYRQLLQELEALADKADQPEYRQFGITPDEIRRLVNRETPTN